MPDTNTDEGFSKTYGVELLFDSKPKIDINAAVAELKKKIGGIDHKNSGDQNMFFLLDHQVEYENGKIPSQLMLIYAEPEKDKDPLNEEVQQSWQTPNAAEIVGQSKFKVLLTDIMSSGLEPKDRQAILSSAVRAFTKHSNCIGIANKITQQIIDAGVLNNSDDPLLGFINIRFFNAGEQGLIMDSLGLAALGLYDVQCHFFDLDPNKVSSQLYNIAYYVFDEEPQFENGHTVAGVDNESWKVLYASSLVAPTRDILDIDPGSKFAAGNR